MWLKQAKTHFKNCMKNIYNIHDISSFFQDVVFLTHDLNVLSVNLKKNTGVKSLNQRDQPEEQNINFLFLCRSRIFTVKSHLDASLNSWTDLSDTLHPRFRWNISPVWIFHNECVFFKILCLKFVLTKLHYRF